jgi:ribosomal protein S18 acetylase RimI-like enzyme
MRTYGADLLDIADEISETYVEVFAAPPWNRDPGETLPLFRERLGRDVHRPGFRAVVAHSDAGIDGFATGWTTDAPFRTDRSYPKVAAQLGPERLAAQVVGAFEVDELAVRARARGTGLGRRLLTELVRQVPDGRAWLLTARNATDTVAFYERVGWHRVEPSPGVENDIVVFLAPQHPHAGR